MNLVLKQSPKSFLGSQDPLLKRILLSLIVTILLLFVLLNQISFKDPIILLSTIDPFGAILGSLAYLLSTLLRALRFKWLIYSKEISLLELFKITSFYHLSLMILPSKLGELSYPYFLNKLGGMSITEGLASLIASRVYDFFIILIVFLFVSIGIQSFLISNQFLTLLLCGLLTGLIFFAFFFMSNLLRWLSNLFDKVLKRMKSGDFKIFLQIQKKINEMAEDFYAIKARKTYLAVSITTLLSWGMIFLTFFAYMKGFGINLSLTQMVFGSTLSIIANALPISGIGNWGTMEVGWTAGFLWVGISKEKAIATGLAVHIMIFILVLLLSSICWMFLKKQ